MGLEAWLFRCCLLRAHLNVVLLIPATTVPSGPTTDPSDSCPAPIAIAFAEGSEKMAGDIARIGIISLVSAADNAAPAAPVAPPGLGLRREPSGMLGGQAGAGGEPPQRRAGQTAAALELAAAPYAAPLTAVAAGNQKLALLAAFLKIGDWEHAQQLMRWLSALGLSDFAVFPAVGAALCELSGWGVGWVG